MTVALTTTREPSVRQPAPRPLAADEGVLLAGLRRGEQRSYEQLVMQHGGRMLAVARRILRHEEDARDAVQDAFRSAYRAIGNFDGRSSLSTWLHRVTTNAALMRLRSATRRAETSLDDVADGDDERGYLDRLSDPAAEAPEARLMSGRVRDQVRRGLNRLSQRQRLVIVLRDIEGLSTRETAQALHTSENAVKIRLHRARLALGAVLREAEPGAAAPLCAQS